MKEEKWLKNINPKDGYYITGFSDGEGSFNISIRKRDNYIKNWKLSASFNISQKDRVVLSWIKKILGCGTLRERKDGVVYYEVTNINSLNNKIIPFFEKYKFISANKKKNFSIFKKIISLMYKNEHLKEDDFKKIMELKERLNEGAGRKRKYTINNIYKN